MRCNEIMRSPVEIARSDETVVVGARRMRDANVGFLPLVDEVGRVVGVVTDRDLAVRACARGLLPDAAELGDVMSVDVIACRPTDELDWAARLMALNRVSRVVVVDPEDHPIGVISLSDLASHLDDASATLRRIATREVRDEIGHRI